MCNNSIPGNYISRFILWNPILLFLIIELGVLQSIKGEDNPPDLVYDTIWKSTNPGAGGAFGVVGAGPTGVIIVGADLSGAYRSLDRGQTWDLIGSYRGLTDTHICGLGFDPADASIIFIGAEHGLFRSNDTGSTVVKVINDGYITDIMVDPTDNSIAYAAFHSKYNTTDGKVYRSTDHGINWQQISADLPSGLHILKLLINPENPDTLYILSGVTDYSNGQRIAYRSYDGGIHWTRMGSSLGEVKDLKLDKSDPSTLYLSTYLVEPDDYGYLYRSEDYGDNWTEVVHRTGYIWLDPEDPGFIRLIELDFQYPGGSRSGVWASSDSGTNWYRLSDIGENWDRGWSQNFHYSGSFNGDIKTFGEDMSDKDVLFWITSQWVFGSFDGGLTFQNLYTNEIATDNWHSRGINNAVLFDIEISPANSDIIYLGYFDLGFFRSMDHGMSWENCNHKSYTGAWKGDGGSSYAIAADPVRPNIVWASQGQDRGTTKVLLRSSNWGTKDTWEKVGNGLPTTSSLFGLSVNPYSADSNRTLLMTANHNVYMSNDDGYNWTLALDCNGKCHFTAIDHFDGDLVYAGGSGGVWRSESGGSNGSWVQVGLAEMKGNVSGDMWDYGWTGVTDIETDPLNPDWIYVSVIGTNKGLYRSKNRGDTWGKLLSDDYMRGVAVSTANPDIIYAASSKPLNAGGYNTTSHGVLRSTDGGMTWIQVNEGLAWPFASAIEIDPGSPDIVLIASPGEGCNVRNFTGQGPVRSSLRPHGTLNPGTTSTTLSLTTKEAASCKYSTSPGTEFKEMPFTFSTEDGITHSSIAGDLSDGGTYTYYCRCRDEAGIVNTDDFQITFCIGRDATGIADSFEGEALSIQVNNLSTGDVNFSVTQATPGDFMLRVYDITGRQVWSYKQAGSYSGTQNIIWKDPYYGQEYSHGIYCVVLSSAENIKSVSKLFMK